MSWEKRDTKIAEHFEFLRRENGSFVGFIIRFNEKEPAFAWTEHSKVGSFNSIGIAKDAIEELL